MKKILTTLALATASVISANAQNENAGTATNTEKKSIFHVSLGADGAMPIGGWRGFYSAGFGGSAKGSVQLCDQAAITLTAGYIRFFEKGVTGTNIVDQNANGVGYIPVKAGFQYMFGPMYIEPEAGMGHFTGAYSDDGATGFAYAGVLGVKFNVFDLSARYEGITNHGSDAFLGLRLAVGF